MPQGSENYTFKVMSTHLKHKCDLKPSYFQILVWFIKPSQAYLKREI